MKKKRLFRCGECGDDVYATRGPGRLAEYRRGVTLPVPSDFELPICQGCGEQYFTVERGERLYKLQKPAYEEWLRLQAAKLIKHIQAESQVTLANLEYACGVSHTYFSQLQNGKRNPSLALVRLLEAFASYPAELARHRKGEAWKPSELSAEDLGGLALEARQEAKKGTNILSFRAQPMAPAQYVSPLGMPEAPSNDNLAA